MLKLPYSMVELVLWHALLTDLQELTRLTDLKKLIMPVPPTQQQLHIIRHLRQLRLLEVTGRAGMFIICFCKQQVACASSAVAGA